MGCTKSKPNSKSDMGNALPIGGPAHEAYGSDNEEEGGGQYLDVNDVLELPRAHKGAILGVEWIGESRLATCGDDKNIAIYDLETCSLEGILTGHTKAISRVCYAPNSNFLYSCSRDLTIKQWALGEGGGGSGAVQSLEGHQFTVSAIGVDTAERLLASGSRDTATVVWDVATGQHVARAKIPRNLVTCIKWFNNESVFAQGSEDLRIRLWDHRQNMISPAVSFSHGAYFALSLDVSPSGNYIVTSSKGGNSVAGDGGKIGGEVTLFDRRRPDAPALTLPGHGHDATAVRFLPPPLGGGGGGDEPRLFLSASKDQTVKLWDAGAAVAGSSTPLPSPPLPAVHQNGGAAEQPGEKIARSSGENAESGNGHNGLEGLGGGDEEKEGRGGWGEGEGLDGVGVRLDDEGEGGRYGGDSFGDPLDQEAPPWARGGEGGERRAAPGASSWGHASGGGVGEGEEWGGGRGAAAAAAGPLRLGGGSPGGRGGNSGGAGLAAAFQEAECGMYTGLAVAPWGGGGAGGARGRGGRCRAAASTFLGGLYVLEVDAGGRALTCVASVPSETLMMG